MTLREIVGWPNYFAGDDGHIYSKRRGLDARIMAEGRDRDGYHTVQLSTGGTRTRTLRVHTLVATTWHGAKASRDQQVRHLDGNKDNSSPSNLKWGTALENAVDRDEHGTTRRGESNGSSKLDAACVREIRARLAAGETQTSIAKVFGVSQGTIFFIASGQRWRSVA